jgi:hypothetical protein
MRGANWFIRHAHSRARSPSPYSPNSGYVPDQVAKDRLESPARWVFHVERRLWRFQLSAAAREGGITPSKDQRALEGTLEDAGGCSTWNMTERNGPSRGRSRKDRNDECSWNAGAGYSRFPPPAWQLITPSGAGRTEGTLGDAGGCSTWNITEPNGRQPE